MKRFMTVACLLLMMTGPALAETRYVSDMLIVTVRSQAGNNEDILTTIQTGTPLEIIEDQKEFLLVRTDKGVEGYVRSQYVTTELPKAEQIKQLKEENSQLLQKVADLSENLNIVDKKTANLSSTEKELARIRSEYQALQKASANVVQITREREQLQQENTDLAERLALLKEENNLYLRTGVIKWFLAGAGVLLCGWILGKLSRKKKRGFN